MKRYPNYLFITLLCASIISMLSSCKKHDPNLVVKGETKLKMVNAVETETNQDVYVDGEKATTAALAFAQTTDYVKIASGSRNIKFMGANGAQTESTVNYTPSIVYTTFLVSDRTGARDILSVEDNLSNPEAGKAKIKLINLTPMFLTGINVSVQAGTQFVNGLLFKETSSYFTVEAGMNLRYNVVGSTNIKTINGENLVGGKIYTIWFSGTSTATLEAHIITDN